MFPDKCCEDKDELHYHDNFFDQDFLYIVYNGARHVAGDQYIFVKCANDIINERVRTDSMNALYSVIQELLKVLGILFSSMGDETN